MPMRENVALLAEGVDRNFSGGTGEASARVALLAEGVDRNVTDHRDEMGKTVALLAEGVDRNTEKCYDGKAFFGRPPRGGRG